VRSAVQVCPGFRIAFRIRSRSYRRFPPLRTTLIEQILCSTQRSAVENSPPHDLAGSPSMCCDEAIRKTWTDLDADATMSHPCFAITTSRAPNNTADERRQSLLHRQDAVQRGQLPLLKMIFRRPKSSIAVRHPLSVCVHHVEQHDSRVACGYRSRTSPTICRCFALTEHYRSAWSRCF